MLTIYAGQVSSIEYSQPSMKKNIFISFFFVQFDIEDSLHSAAILKSIIRQALSKTELPLDIETVLTGYNVNFPPSQRKSSNFFKW